MMSTKSNWSHSLSVSSIEENYSHSLSRIFLIVFTIITFLFSLFLNGLNLAGVSIFGSQFFFNSSSFFYNFHTEMTPSITINYLWIIIYVWQFLWLIYGVSTICRKSSSDYLYKYPPVMHWLIYLNFSISNILHITCLAFLSRQMFMLASSYSILMFVGLYIATFTSLFKLSDYQREMYYTEKTCDVWCIRLLVQNGMIMYASWSFIMFLFSLDLSLVYNYKLAKEKAHLIVLGLLFIKLVLYFIVENFVSYRYCKFLFTPWIVYGVYLIDTVVTQTLYSVKPGFLDDLVHSSTNELTKKHSLMNLGLNFFFHVCILALFVLLFIGKLLKFVWSEICYQKNITISF